MVVLVAQILHMQVRAGSLSLEIEDQKSTFEACIVHVIFAWLKNAFAVECAHTHKEVSF